MSAPRTPKSAHFHRARFAFRLALFSIAAIGSASLAAACGVFDLADVVPTNGTDGSHLDGNAADSGVDGSDACTPNGDPCACMPAPETISPGPSGLGQSIFVTGGNVYFMLTATGVGGGNPVVFVAPTSGLDGGNPLEVSLSAPIAAEMVSGGSWIYFRRTSAPFAVARVGLDASSLAPISYVVPLTSAPGHLAVDSAHIFWAGDFGAICGAPFDGADPPDGGTYGCSEAPVVDGRDGGPASPQVAASDTDVFEAFTGRVYRAPQATGVLTEIYAQSGAAIGGLTEDNGNIFFSALNTDNDASTIWSVQDDGGAPTNIVPVPLEGNVIAAIFTVDADGVYWGQRSYEKVWSAHRDGTARALVGCEPAGIGAIATDATYVYWVTNGGAVKRAPKP